MQTEHILQFSNNFTVSFTRGGGKVQAVIKEGDQHRATASGDSEDYKRMFDMIVGTIPPSDPKREPKDLGPAPKAVPAGAGATTPTPAKSPSKPFSANPSKP